ncbi:amidase family protein [Marinilactibacillus psychrotolerans]|uniref:Amidase domain-containing protein n=1 Tax=Marinilactibacillus psychrotolerans TaxID=191770 RepID=A0AAV3WQI9_9LACT|nr:amidase family protein [Marinilactibacillus psychrotolerans]GEL67620.1 hypothetical protein MPS01_17750 [Marinilactibacillus psychrotolerans]GEQ35496.1 hypothetical protein M132T_10040 [Marinilactibacillus psychrotolerans]SDD07144.1 Amidase [Marinilactibacillus psychrotolerans]
MNQLTIKKMAKKTFIAMNNPYQSVVKVYPQAIDKILASPFSYIGIKNKPEIPKALIDLFEDTNQYALHTIDSSSLGGRAIDTRLMNPITGRPMTGSSSGTAINVLLGINDLGIGTDGGGSVLAPAMSLNLFSFISPALCKKHVEKFQKKSTDSLSFTPSIGFITRTYDEISKAIMISINGVKSSSTAPLSMLKVENKTKQLSFDTALDHYHPTTCSIDLSSSRESLIKFVSDQVEKNDLIVSLEGPIDLLGLGDTVLGHMGSLANDLQASANKGLIRVANMANAAACTIPTENYGTAYVLICKDTPEHITKMLRVASTLAQDQDPLLEKYFTSFENYFPKEFPDI